MNAPVTDLSLDALPIVCLGYHPWSTMWKRNQSMMAELARQGLCERLVFLNPEVSLATPPARLKAELGTIRRFSWQGVKPRHPEPRTTVLTPIHLVPFRRRHPLLERLDRRLIEQSIRRALGGRRRYVLLVNTVRPESQELVDRLWDDALLRVFDWSDDFARFPLDPRGREQIQRITDRLLDRAELVLCVNRTLAARAGELGANVRTVINATNMQPLPGDWQPPAAARELRRRLGGPILGYAGFINEHRIDLELVVEMARRHPEWTILFVGPVQLEFDARFPDLPNIHFHPPVDYTELQGYLGLFDVCLIPHLENAHTAGNNPLKLYDYLTTGRPVVATRIAGLEGFEDVVSVVEGGDAFIAAVEAALEESGAAAEQAVARRHQRAREHHWANRAREVAGILAEALGGQAEPGSPARLANG